MIRQLEVDLVDAKYRCHHLCILLVAVMNAVVLGCSSALTGAVVWFHCARIINWSTEILLQWFLDHHRIPNVEL